LHVKTLESAPHLLRLKTRLSSVRQRADHETSIDNATFYNNLTPHQVQ